jgi:(p)ppGpp synthase/HD superfamily hydrolase
MYKNNIRKYIDDIQETLAAGTAVAEVQGGAKETWSTYRDGNIRQPDLWTMFHF